MNSKMNKKLIVAFIFTFAIFMYASAQEVKSVHAIIEYELSDSETKAQARITAIKRARQKAIEEEFGLVVAQTNFTNINDGDLHFRSIGISDLAGEWLGDTKDPVINFVTQGDRIVIKAEVWGKARRIVSEEIELDVHVLRKDPSKENATRVFQDNDLYYLTFKSPIDGYLAVYMMDDSLNYQRILPYMNSSLRSYQVEGNKDYISHYKGELPGYANFEESSDIAHMVLAPGKDKEECQFYVIFSPNNFLDPDDTKGATSYKHRKGLSLPPSVEYSQMQEWLRKNRLHDKSMQVVKIPITIIPKESW